MNWPGTKLNSQRQSMYGTLKWGKVWMECATVCQKDQTTEDDCKLMGTKTIDLNVALRLSVDTVANFS